MDLLLPRVLCILHVPLLLQSLPLFSISSLCSSTNKTLLLSPLYRGGDSGVKKASNVSEAPYGENCCH